MNLEQIKETQENINTQLSKVLEELRTIVNFIAGEAFPVLGVEEEGVAATNGILENITYKQEKNITLIGELHRQVVILSNRTYQREDIA
jgi:hypothetical protein